MAYAPICVCFTSKITTNPPNNMDNNSPERFKIITRNKMVPISDCMLFTPVCECDYKIT